MKIQKYFYLFSSILLGALFFVFATQVSAEVTISDVLVNKVMKSGFNIAWTTSTPGKSFKIKYGLTSAYGYETTVFTDPSSTRRQIALTGLRPGTTYHFCIDQTDVNNDTTVCDGTKNDFTGTTIGGSTLPASLPELPRAYVDTTMPTQNGATRTVPAGDCQNPTTGLQAQMNAAQYGDTIVIPAGTVCTGQFTAPPKSGSGWIIVRTSTPDAQLPPQGTRISPSVVPLLATIRTNQIGAYWPGTGKPPYCAGGEGGKINYKWDDAGKLGLYECNSDGSYFEIPYTSGTTVPTSCTEGAWFYKTDAVRGKHVYRCVQPNKMEELNPANYAGNTEALVLPSGSRNWRFIGIDFTHVPMPNVTLNYDSQKNPRLAGNQYNGLVIAEKGSDRIIFDRIYLHGLDFPSRLWAGLTISGTNVAVIDSVFDKINMWTAADANSTESAQPAIQITSTQGPIKIVNNQISCIGICLFSIEGQSGPNSVSDVEVRGNYFYKPLKYLYGSSQSDGYRYFNRHHLELKRGKRWLIDGNIFENNWATVAQGASIALTVRPTSPSLFNEDSGIYDITITNNIFKNTTTGMVLTGQNDFIPKDLGNTPISGRYRVSNNLFVINGKLADPLGLYPTGRGGNPIMAYLGIEDLIIDHNTVADAQGSSPSLMYTSCTQPNSGLEVKDNIVNIPVGTYGFLWGGFCNVTEGLGALNEAWSLSPYTPAYNVTNNVFVGKPSSSSKYPSGNFFPSSGGVSFANSGGGDYTLLTVAYKGKASDGSDPGVNMSQLSNATINTINGGATSIFVPVPYTPSAPSPSSPSSPTPSTPSTPTFIPNQSINTTPDFTPSTTVDTIEPTISISAPTAKAELKGIVQFIASASDNDKVSSVQFVLDGYFIGRQLIEDPYSVWINTTSQFDGPHRLFAFVRDRAGNIAQTDTIDIYINNYGSSTFVPQTDTVLNANTTTASTTQTQLAVSTTTQTTAVNSNTPGSLKSISQKLTRPLSLGSRGADVSALQAFLSQDTALYPEGSVTGFFGPLTEKAVGRFQVRYNLSTPGSPAYGFVGPKTRVTINGI